MKVEEWRKDQLKRPMFNIYIWPNIKPDLEKLFQKLGPPTEVMLTAIGLTLLWDRAERKARAAKAKKARATA